MSSKELISTDSFPCHGYVKLTCREKESGKDEYNGLREVSLNEVQATVQHFRDGSTRVLCPRIQEEGLQRCRAWIDADNEELTNIAKKANDHTDDTSVEIRVEGENIRCPYDIAAIK